MIRTGALAVFLCFVSAVFAQSAVDQPIVDQLVRVALAQKGVPYRSAGFSPKGFDCSGLIYFVFSQRFPQVPPSTNGLEVFGAPLDRRDVKPGDLILFATGRNPKVVSHVALYVGQNTMIHAASQGPRTGVILSDLDEPYWKARTIGFRRPPYGSDSLPLMERTGKIYSMEYAKGWYRGPLVAGEPHGKGFYFLRNGDSYVGDLERGYFSGTGVFRWRSGFVYQGRFRLGHFDGEGTLFAPDGAWLKATWKDDRPTSDFAYGSPFEAQRNVTEVPSEFVVPSNPFWTEDLRYKRAKTPVFPDAPS